MYVNITCIKVTHSAYLRSDTVLSGLYICNKAFSDSYTDLLAIGV